MAMTDLDRQIRLCNMALEHTVPIDKVIARLIIIVEALNEELKKTNAQLAIAMDIIEGQQGSISNASRAANYAEAMTRPIGSRP